MLTLVVSGSSAVRRVFRLWLSSHSHPGHWLSQIVGRRFRVVIHEFITFMDGITHIRVVVWFIAGWQMRDGRRWHQVRWMRSSMIDDRYRMVEWIQTIHSSAFSAGIIRLSTRKAWRRVVPIMTPHVRVYIKLSATTRPRTPERYNEIKN